MNKRNKKVLSVCSLASLIISSSVVSTGVKAASSQPSSTRISGTDRYETAVQVSKTGWTSSDYVVIANGQGYADALCATPLAKAKNAPVLLTQSGTLSSSTIAEIKRLNAKHVIIVGGTGVVKSSIEDTIKSQTSADITRYAGADRYETSTKIAAAIGNTSKIVLASGQGFADALSAAPAASIEGIPILLTQANTLSQKTADYIKANSGITKTYVIGGTASVSDSVLGQVPSGQRFGGADRFATNAAVINGLSSDFNFSNLYVALGVGPTGNEFADALTGTALAAKNKSALVITSNPLSSYTKDLLNSKLTTGSTITVLGGTANISDSIVSQLKDAVTKTGTTTGGGSGSGSVYDANNKTASIIDLVGADNIKSALEKYPTVEKYFSVGTSNSEITLTVKDTYKDNVATPADIFKSAKDPNVNADKIQSKLDTAFDLASDHINTVTSESGKTFKQILSQAKTNGTTFANSKYAKYVGNDGSIYTEKLAADIKTEVISKGDYQTFVSKLGDAVSHSITNKATSPKVKISTEKGTLDIGRIDQGSTTLYDSSISRIANVNLILGLKADGTPTNAETSTTGTYKLYYDNSNANNYFDVTVR